MERTLPLRTDGSAAASLGIGLLRIVPLLGLFAWHGWLTLSLFGCENRWQQLLDDRQKTCIVVNQEKFFLPHGTWGRSFSLLYDRELLQRLLSGRADAGIGIT